MSEFTHGAIYGAAIMGALAVLGFELLALAYIANRRLTKMLEWRERRCMELSFALEESEAELAELRDALEEETSLSREQSLRLCESEAQSQQRKGARVVVYRGAGQCNHAINAHLN